MSEKFKCFFDKRKDCRLHEDKPHAYAPDNKQCTNCLLSQVLAKLK